MGATRGITNMAIAHEIAVNSDFKLEKLQFPQDRYSISSLRCYSVCIRVIILLVVFQHREESERCGSSGILGSFS